MASLNAGPHLPSSRGGAPEGAGATLSVLTGAVEGNEAAEVEEQPEVQPPPQYAALLPHHPVLVSPHIETSPSMKLTIGRTTRAVVYGTIGIAQQVAIIWTTFAILRVRRSSHVQGLSFAVALERLWPCAFYSRASAPASVRSSCKYGDSAYVLSG
jgi:hypothetical protein